jgi:acyl-CoA synthetase (AMP-forming)/AMP-acid ligase II
VEGWGDTLEESGVAPGSTVGLVIADPIDFSVAFLGTIASGRWAAPLDPSTPAPGLEAALARVQAHIVFSDPPTTPGGLRAEWVDRPRPVDPEWSDEEVSGGAVLASSGTTGVPKVIPLHQGRLLHTARQRVGPPSTHAE